MKKLGIFSVFLLFLVSVQLQSQQWREGPPSRDGRFQKPDKGTMFKNMDLNGDSYVSFDEFSTHFANRPTPPGHHGQNMPEPDISKIFDSIDTNGDDKISFTEFKDHKPQGPPRRDFGQQGDSY